MTHFKMTSSTVSFYERLDLLHQLNDFLPFKSLVNCVRKQACNKEVSHITYIERADYKPTLIGVISRLQKIFVKDFKQKYVLEVGDAKTYNLSAMRIRVT